MRKPKYHLYLTHNERLTVINSLICLKNDLISQDKYTDAVDELIVKLTKAKVKIGVFGQRHKRYLQEHHKLIYFNLLTSCKLAAYLADIDSQANEMYDLLVQQLSEKENISEHLKAEKPMEWTRKMNIIRLTATEIVNREIIYT